MQFSLLPDFLRAQTHDPMLDQISPLIDDTAIDDQLAIYYPSFSMPQGRPPYWPSGIIRMHLLLFLKRISSFNRLCEAVCQTPAYQKFCGFQDADHVPTPGQLSQFRTRIGAAPLQQLVAQLLRQVTADLDPDTLPVGVVLVDSRPVKSYTAETKRKRCTHTASCDCPRIWSDPDAQRGWRKPTPSRKEYFVGYRKHAAYLLHPAIAWRLPLYSALYPANVPDIQVLEEVLTGAQQRTPMPITYAVVDQGYYDFERFATIQETLGITVLVKPKTNARATVPATETHIPLCPANQPLDWVTFDADSQDHCYRCPWDHPETQCIEAGTCPQHFAVPQAAHPVLFAALPAHHWIRRTFERLRKRIETEFGVHTHQFGLDRLKFRGLAAFRALSPLMDWAQIVYRRREQASMGGSPASSPKTSCTIAFFDTSERGRPQT